jgi:tetratricopeptide (TPR) repeat protein
MTDRTGKFVFTHLNPDQFWVSVRAEGYKEIRQQVDLQTSPKAYLVIELQPVGPDASSSSTPPTPSFDANVPADARREFEKGQEALLQRKEVEKGVRHLEKAVALYPKFLEAQLLLGTAYMDANQWDKAERTLRQVLEAKPQAAGALFALGELYLQQKKYAESEHVLVEGLGIDEASWQGHLTLAKVYWATGDVAKATPQASRAHELNPDVPQVHLMMGNVLLRNRDARGALTEFEDYLKLDPNGSFAAPTRALVEKIRKALEPPKH